MIKHLKKIHVGFQGRKKYLKKAREHIGYVVNIKKMKTIIQKHRMIKHF